MIRYFAAHRSAANLLMLALICLGVLGAWNMRRETFPDFASDIVATDLTYPGAAAAEIEENVVFKIEDAVDGIDGIAEINSLARDGFCSVRAKVADGYDPRSVQLDVQNAIDRIDTFPAQADKPIVYQLEQPDRVLSLALYGEVLPGELERLANDIKDHLVASPAVSLATVEGFSEQQIRIELEQRALLQWGLSIDDVARCIAAESLDSPAGSVEAVGGKTSLRLTDQSRSVADFENIVVLSSPRGGLIRLGDVATISDTYDETDQSIRFDGRRAAIIHIDATDNEDSLKIAAEVQHLVGQLGPNGLLPEGVEIAVWGNLARDVKGRLDLLIDNGLIGFVLVLLVLAAFLNLRLAFWVAMGIPVSFLGTIFAMHLLGYTLNMITMFSLVLALGLIVDDAIVLSENIYVHFRKGKSPLQAAVDGVREVWVGVTASTLTTVAAFLPLLFMTGDIGKTLRVMPIGVLLALGISLIEGFLILPAHLRHSLKHEGDLPPIRLRRLFDEGVERLVDRFYRPALGWALKFRYTAVAAAVALFMVCAAYVASGRLEFTPFPKLDGNVIQAQVILPAGTHISIAEKVAQRLEEGLAAINADAAFEQGEEELVKHVMVQFGSIPAAGVGAVESDETGSHVLTVIAELLRSEDRRHTADQVISAWRSFTIDIPEVVSIRYKQQQINPGGQPVQIELAGADLEALKQAALDLRGELAHIPGLSDPDDNLRKGAYEAKITLRDSARPLGITSAELARQLRGAFYGETAQEFQRGRDTVEVRVVFADRDRRSEADLGDFRFIMPGGRLVPLHEIAEVEISRGYAQIHRTDRLRTVTITAELDEDLNNAAKIAGVLQSDIFPRLEQAHGVRARVTGQTEESQQTAKSIEMGLLIGVAIIYVLLAWVFASFTLPLIVMAAIPLSFIGAVIGHVVMGFDLTMPSLVGFVSLSGIVVNDSVILLQTLRAKLKAGVPLQEAAQHAGFSRFRAVLLTSLTTVAGLTPMLLETSLQAQFLIPVAISVCFGLGFVTALVLLIVPSLYMIWEDGRRLVGYSAEETDDENASVEGADADDLRRAA